MRTVAVGRCCVVAALGALTCGVGCASILGAEDGILDPLDASGDSSAGAAGTGGGASGSAGSGGSGGAGGSAAEGGGGGSLADAGGDVREDATEGGIDAPNDRADDGTSTTDASDATTDAADGAGDASDGGVDADPCPLRVADESVGVFVHPMGFSTSGCGTRAVPCDGVQRGVDRAVGTGKSIVYVATGVYLEQVHLAAGITIEGAWTESGSTWSPECGPGAHQLVVIQAPSTVRDTIVAVDLGGVATLRSLSVDSRAATAVAPGESVFSVFATGATTELVLDRVAVFAAAGGTGANGTPGSSGSPGTGSCSAGTGAIGGGGPPGGDSAGGSFDSAGYTPGGGTTGTIGSDGSNGTATGGQCSSCHVNCSGTVPDCSRNSINICAASGAPGCGGGGGGPGGGGGGGGSSIAVFAWDAVVTFVGGSLTASDGGDAGDGGAPGPGGGGSSGSTGTNASCDSIACIGIPFTDCSHIVTSSSTLSGGIGGNGGEGGPGGVGGGGSGGSSCSFYAGGSAIMNATGTAFAFGSPGDGGLPNGSVGVGQVSCP